MQSIRAITRPPARAEISQRKRSLTIPLPEHQQRRNVFSFRKHRQKTYDQLQSPLFQLPFELRALIWKHAIGGLFVVVGNAVACQISTSGSANGARIPHNEGFLHLLVTCRRIYSEAIEFLYSTSVFEFPDPFRMFFDWEILPQRLHAIKALVIHPIYARHADFQVGWRHYWDMVSQLRSLRYLYANIVYSFSVTEEGIMWMFEPLMNVRQLDDFYVTLIWPPGDNVDHPVMSLRMRRSSWLRSWMPLSKDGDRGTVDGIWTPLPRCGSWTGGF